MSVINQMLMDLEKRRAGASEGAVLPNQVRPLPRASERSREIPWGYWALAAATLVLGFVVWWVARQNLPQSPQAAPDATVNGAPSPVPPITQAAQANGAPASPPVVKWPAPLPRPAKPQADDRGLRLSPVLSPDTSAKLTSPALTASTPAAAKADPVSAPAPASTPAPQAVVVPVPAPSPPITSSATASAPMAAPIPKSESAPRVDPVRADASAKTAEFAPGTVDKQARPLTQRDRADVDYRRATAALNQGKANEAIDALRAALLTDPGFDAARQTLVGVLVEQKRNDEAQRLLQDALASRPSQLNFAMLLARMQLDRGDNAGAVASMSRALPYAADNADFLGFSAALLQRVGRNTEAVEQYRAALRLRPDAAVWWMGLGISLQASERSAEALDAFRRALSSGSMSPELQAFVEQRIKQLTP
jgi:MSHA biogenesis protein MshN